MNTDWFISACLGLGLAACCGFRVFVPLLVASVATRMGLIGASSTMAWLGSWPALVGLSLATLLEGAAYYIPWLDNALDTLATPMAVVAGTLLSTSFLHIDNPLLHWGLGLMLGGSSAGLIQAGTSLLRLGSTATTGGLANPLVSTGENLAALLLSILAVLLPVLAVVLIGGVLFWVGGRLTRRRRTTGPKPDNE
jgi:Domain of unknown function (DUF4126)